MKKVLASVVLSSVLVFGGVVAYGDEVTTAASAIGNLLGGDFDLSSITELMDGVNLDALHLDNFDIRNVDIDGLVQSAKDSSFLKNLDISSLNLDAVVDMVDDTDILKSVGIESIDKEKLLDGLKDERISNTIDKLMTSASNGESIADSVRALAKKDSVKELFSSITNGMDLTTVLKGLNTENVTELLKKGAAAIFGAKTAAASTETAEISSSVEGLLTNGLSALLGKN